jgi:YebC/PmpR family DNA-binding regulatory protein
MSGHSKWSQIKRKKGMNDEKKGQIFSKISHLITLAVKEGGGIADPDNNLKLRLAVEKAKKYNMPKENIQRAIEKAKGVLEYDLREVVYEGFSVGGISLIILATTDNPNRTLSEVRKILEQNGAKFGASGSTVYHFEKCGIVIYNKEKINEDRVLQLAEKLKAKDIEAEENYYNIFIPFEHLGRIEKLIDKSFPQPESIDIHYRPLTKIEITNKEVAEKVILLIEALEGLEDVQKVYANSSFPL